MDSLLLDPPKAHLRYLDIPGDGPPIVWVHGMGGASSADFPSVAASPALIGHRSILVDLLGHGYSDAPESFSYSLEDHAHTVAQLMNRLGLKDCALFGHSMGGAVVITLAAFRPDLVSRLIIAEGNLDPGGGSTSSSIAAQTEHEFATTGRAALLELISTHFGATRVATFQVCSPLGLYRSAVGLVKATQPTMRDRLYAFDIPTAYVFGERSLPDPDEEALASHGVRVLVVLDAAHDMPTDNPGGLADAVAEALTVT